MHSRVFLVRHGATVLTAEDRFAGATEVELSDEGREQVRRLAVRLAGEKIAAIYASPMGRTVETASILAEPHGLEVQTRGGLRYAEHIFHPGILSERGAAVVHSRSPDRTRRGGRPPRTAPDQRAYFFAACFARFAAVQPSRTSS